MYSLKITKHLKGYEEHVITNLSINFQVQLLSKTPLFKFPEGEGRGRESKEFYRFLTGLKRKLDGTVRTILEGIIEEDPGEIDRPFRGLQSLIMWRAPFKRACLPEISNARTS